MELGKEEMSFKKENHWQKNCIKKLKSNEGGCKFKMATRTKVKEVKEIKRESMRCQRCGGRMIFEKFYDVNSVFFGWHCVICGEILDPVILLHRLTQDADLRIPEEEEELMLMVKKYLQMKPKELKNKGKSAKGIDSTSYKEDSRFN